MDIEKINKFYKNKKVLITGHNGFKGSWLSKILVMFGAEVSGFSLKPNTNPSLFNVLNLENEINSYYGDITNLNELKNVIEKEKPEIIFHLAAQPLVRKSYEDPVNTYKTNILGTVNLLDSLKRNTFIKSVVMITTDKVYENKEWVFPYRENDRLGGYDPYSSSKACAELVIKSYRDSFFNLGEYKKNHNILIASCRGGNVIGGGDWSKDRIVPDIIKSIYEDNNMLEIRSPNAIRPWQHVLELLSGYLLIGKYLYEGNKNIADAWNFGPNSENFLPVKNLVESGIKVLGKGEYKFMNSKNKMHEAKILKLEIEKAKSFLNWYPKLTFEETMIWTFKWYRKYYNKDNIIIFTEKQTNFRKVL